MDCDPEILRLFISFPRIRQKPSIPHHQSPLQYETRKASGSQFGSEEIIRSA